MNYVIKLFYGSHIIITDNECQQIFENWDKLDKFVIKSASRIIDKRLIAEILTEEDFSYEKQEIENTKRQKQQVGILHDGIKVVKHFGRWVKEDSLYTSNENGETKAEPCNFDYNYYPEIALNLVKTPEEYFEWKNTKTEYLPEGKKSNLRIGNMTSISNIF